MDWNFIANNPDELASIGNALFTASKLKHLDEQVQMTRLLEAVPVSSILQFPVRVRHSGEKEVPDFQLESGGRRIAVELAKVAVQDVEHARGLQRTGLNRTLGISSLYRKQPKPRSKDEVVAEGFLIPAMVFPVSIEEHEQVWCDELAAQLRDKTSTLHGSQFVHGDEDWLLLWDRIGTADYEVAARTQTVANMLAPWWKTCWFSRVFIQDAHFFWLLAFTAHGHVRLK